MFKRKLTLATLMIAAGLLAACRTPKQPTETPQAGLPNPASAYCEQQGGTLDIRTDASGGQYGVCMFDDGSECDEWAYFRGECAPGQSTTAPEPPAATPEPAAGGGEMAGETVGEIDIAPLASAEVAAGWLGYVASLPAGTQFDDKLVLMPEGSGEMGIAGVNDDLEAQIVALRDHPEPGKYANFWGSLACDVPDVNGCQLLVSAIRVGPTLSEPQPVEGWPGTIVSNPEGMQFDDTFLLDGRYAVRYGISPAVDASGEMPLTDTIVGLRDTDTPVVVYGTLLCGVPDVNGCQIQVERIETAE